MFKKSIEDNNIVNIKLLLKDKEVDPSYDNNWAAIEIHKKAFFSKITTYPMAGNLSFPIETLIVNEDCINDDILLLLWNDKRVKNTLKKDYFNLYNKLIKKDVIKKLVIFNDE